MNDDEIIMDDETGGIGGDDIAMNDDIMMEDDDLIMEDDDLIMDANAGGDQYAMADEEVIVDDQELEQYLGEDAMAEVNEEPVEFVNDSQDLVADTTSYIPEDNYDNSMEMEADVYDDSMDMV